MVVQVLIFDWLVVVVAVVLVHVYQMVLHSNGAFIDQVIKVLDVSLVGPSVLENQKI